MRILKTTKPIPSWYLKSGQDQGAYDVEKLIWLPGNTKPIRVPNLKLLGMRRRGEHDATIAPPPKQQPNRPGLYVPPGYIARERIKKAKLVSSAA